MSSDISGVAIQLTQSLDNETALEGAIEWKNVADKMARLFKEGLAKELVNSGEKPSAVTDFARLNISASFKEWRPRSDSEYNQMLLQLLGSNIISAKTAIQKNTEATPDEEMRIRKETEERERRQAEIMENQAAQNTSGTDRQTAQNTEN